MKRLVARATAVPRPAKLARQTSQARRSLRACQDCRAGFAGRDMQVVRGTKRSTLASGPDPGRSPGSD